MIASYNGAGVGDERYSFKLRAPGKLIWIPSWERPKRSENAMAFQAVPDTVEIDMIFTQNGITVQNVFYAEKTGGYVLSDLEDLASAVDLQWQGTWRDQQPDEVTYLRTEVRGLAEENDLVAIDSFSTNNGTHVGDAMPNNVTFSVKKVSGLTGRSARGRTYWIGVPRTELTAADENEIESDYVAEMITSVDSIRTAIGGVSTWEPVLVSRFKDGAARAEGVTFPWIGTTSVDNRIDTQRGRLN